ncbi:MAG: hypothetical protein IJ442_01415 [Bacteroidaceae bacterium]|nr:hypothetical protein [Bacteroidaceae bacterium]
MKLGDATNPPRHRLQRREAPSQSSPETAVLPCPTRCAGECIMSSNVPPTSPSLRSARWGLSYSRILRCSTRPSDDMEC